MTVTYVAHVGTGPSRPRGRRIKVDESDGRACDCAGIPIERCRQMRAKFKAVVGGGRSSGHFIQMRAASCSARRRSTRGACAGEAVNERKMPVRPEFRARRGEKGGNERGMDDRAREMETATRRAEECSGRMRGSSSRRSRRGTLEAERCASWRGRRWEA